MGDNWLTWPQAADLIGCPIGTVEHATRTNRIRTRPHHGNRPTLERQSVEHFAEWWQERQAFMAWKLAQPNKTHPPDPEGWLTTEEAAERLGVSLTSAVRIMRDRGRRIAKRGRRVYVQTEAVELVAAERAVWVSIAEAQRIAGRASSESVRRAVERGLIEQRPGPRQRPSLRRSSVEAWAAERAKPKPPREPKPRLIYPPTEEHEWLQTSAAAKRLGISGARLRLVASEERVPATWHCGRYWFRVDLLEQYLQARDARRRERGV